MNEIAPKLTELLKDKSFVYNNKEYLFMSCKLVYSNLMIITNKEILQVPIDAFDVFYSNVMQNCKDAGVMAAKSGFVPSELPLRNNSVILPETPALFSKINDSFDAMIDLITNATEADMGLIESKAKMLTSVAQTAVNMENTRVSLIKMFNK